MANLWITGDSWGTLDDQEPDTHWINFFKQKHELKNIYCLAKPGMAQDAINYLTHCVVKNTRWPGRDVRWNNMDDYLIVFPTTPTRVTFNSSWGEEKFDEQLGPHNIKWKEKYVEGLYQTHPWYNADTHQLANLESENFSSAQMRDWNRSHQILKEYSLIHSCNFADWKDTNHLNHIIKEVNNVLVYGSSRLPTAGQIWGVEENWPPAIGKEQANHLTANRHIAYWDKVKHNV
tara:strand:- start:5748 stop:6446 length:699 start_codon:yes stop_codon:yes gene_type:complete